MKKEIKRLSSISKIEPTNHNSEKEYFVILNEVKNLWIPPVREDK